MSKVESKPRFSLNQKLIFSALIMIAVVISIPLVYAIVEPHIKITMDGAQTTKPFLIVDSQNNEVFSIDTDGTLFPDPTADIILNQASPDYKYYVEYTHEDVIIYGTGSDNGDYNNWLVLAEYRIDFNSLTENEGSGDTSTTYPAPIFIGGSFLNGFVKSSSGTFDAEISVRWTRDGGATWFTLSSISRDGFFYSAMHQLWKFGDADEFCTRDRTSNPPEQNECIISIRQGTFYTGTISTHTKDVRVYAEILLPAQTTMTQTFP